MMKVLVVVACAIIGSYAQSVSSPCAGQPAGALVADPKFCGAFYHCTVENGEWTSCPGGLYFNSKLQVCDFPGNVNCPEGSGGAVNPGTGGQPVTSSPGCGGNIPSNTVIAPCTSLEATTISTTDCTQYIYCYQGYPYTVKCDAGKYYSAQHHSCITAASCPSDGGTVVTPSPCGGTTVTNPCGGTVVNNPCGGTVVNNPCCNPGTSTSCGGGTVINNSISCPATGADTFDYPGDTTKYYYCYNGIAYTVQCRANQQYSALSKSCINI